MSVSDEEILLAARTVAGEGFALEPASAAAVACAAKVAAESREREVWVRIGTGAAVKWPSTLNPGISLPPRLPADFDRVDDVIQTEPSQS